MTESEAERWRRIDVIFDEALELPEAERAEFVARACGTDAELRSRVSELLAADARPPGILDHTEGALATLHEDAASREGRRVGAYRLLGKLGEGGMGIVFEAEQEHPRRRVALKLNRGGTFASDDDLRAFQREIRSLARLEHPGIASIYDAGRTPEGESYFAMELVAGRPLDAFLASTSFDPQDRGSLRARLELFLRICDAVGYAHQRGIIHRDLKPSNVLVSEGSTPQPKILDFGIAQETDRDVTTLRTQIGHVRGTLSYMSPEQARGDQDAQDVRTDVYSLGVMLYEMLTGRLPLDVRGRTLPEAVRILSDEAAVRPGAIRPALRGDLDTILLKALEKSPDQRYASVPALAEDVRRFLADQPIFARPPSTLYQIRKLLRRHRLPFAFAASLVLLVLLFGVTMSVMYQRQRVATARAERQTEKAQRTLSFLRDMLTAADPAKAHGHDVTVREVLDRSASAIDSSLAGEDDVRGAIQQAVGSTYLSLGVYPQAEAMLRSALATQKKTLATGDPQVLETSKQLAMVLFQQGKGAEMEAVAREAADAARARYGPSRQTATTLSTLGLAQYRLGELAPAESTFRAAIDMLAHDPAEHGRELAMLNNSLGIALRGENKFEDALAAYRSSAEGMTKALGAADPQTMHVRYNVGVTLGLLHRDAEAADSLRALLDDQRRIQGKEHPDALRTESVLGETLHATGKNEEAAAFLRDAVDRTVRSLGPDHLNVALARARLGNFLFDTKDYHEAEAERREVVRIQRALASPTGTADGLEGLGIAVAAQGRRAEALRDLREAAALFARGYSEKHPRTIQAREEVARLEKGENLTRP